MSETHSTDNLPAEIAGALVSVPHGLIPASVKALDRLIGSAVDIPVAWLAQKRAKIDAQTEAFKLVEASIAKAAAGQAGADQATIERAVNVLVRKEYRKQTNREAVAAAMIEDLQAQHEQPHAAAASPHPQPALDDDWLNVFERYAEDASTERMQKLWGRVLAGEVRKPGQYSMRTLRFLSEFSQADGLTFSAFCASAFGDTAPIKLIRPTEMADIRGLIYMESAGLVQGSGGLPLTLSINLDSEGNGHLREGILLLMLKAKPSTPIKIEVVTLTPLGQELMKLFPQRDVRAAARRYAEAIRTPDIEAAYLAVLNQDRVLPMEILWQAASSPGQAAPAS